MQNVSFTARDCPFHDDLVTSETICLLSNVTEKVYFFYRRQTTVMTVTFQVKDIIMILLSVKMLCLLANIFLLYINKILHAHINFYYSWKSGHKITFSSPASYTSRNFETLLKKSSNIINIAYLYYLYSIRYIISLIFFCIQ